MLAFFLIFLFLEFDERLFLFAAINDRTLVVDVVYELRWLLVRFLLIEALRIHLEIEAATLSVAVFVGVVSLLSLSDRSSLGDLIILQGL